MYDPDGAWIMSREQFMLALEGKHNGHSRQELIMRYLVQESKNAYTCTRPPGAAGALIITPASFIFAGVYPPDKSPNCKEVGCELEWTGYADKADRLAISDVHPHCVRTIHAEQRAIFTAARFGIATHGTVIYSVLKPCYQCTKAIIAAGIFDIYYAGAAYDEERTRKILENAGVLCEKIEVGLEYGQ